MKIASEKIDEGLSNSSGVQIAQLAQAQAEQSPTLWEQIRGAVSGKVERTARIKVERDTTDISGLAERMPAGGYDPYFIQTEFEAIRSDPVLSKAAEKLNLDPAWAKKYRGGDKPKAEETLRLLKKSLDLRQVQGSSSIDIGAKSDNPEDAASIRGHLVLYRPRNAISADKH